MNGFGSVSKAVFGVLLLKTYSFAGIVSNILLYTFALSDGRPIRIVATPVFVQQKQEFIMDNLKPLKSFLTDLITPIVQDAVTNAIPDNIKTKDKNPVPVQKITQMYGISQSKVYAMFRTGELEKIKQGGLTFVDTVQLESLMKCEKLCAKAPMKRK